MSDTAQGSDWWYASDGKWYPHVSPPPDTPPPAAPGAPGLLRPSGLPVGPALPPPPAPPPAPESVSKGSRRAATALGVCVVVLALVVVGGMLVLTRSGTTKVTTFLDFPNNFSIGTPASWQQVSLSDPTAQAAFDKLIAQNPQLAASLGSEKLLATSGVKFIASDPTTGSGVSVIVVSAPGAPADPSDSDLEAALPDLTSGIASMGATITSHQIVTVNGHKAFKILYVVPLTKDGAKLTVHLTAYLFATKDTVHIVTIVGTDDVVERVISTFTIG